MTRKSGNPKKETRQQETVHEKALKSFMSLKHGTPAGPDLLQNPCFSLHDARKMSLKQHDWLRVLSSVWMVPTLTKIDLHA